MDHLDPYFVGCITFDTQVLLLDSEGVSAIILPRLFTSGGDSGTYFHCNYYSMLLSDIIVNYTYTMHDTL